MARESAAFMDELVKAHRAAADRDIARLRALGLRERGVLIESACAAAAALERSRRAAGLAAAKPAPWSPSTWDFLRKHTARVRT